MVMGPGPITCAPKYINIDLNYIKIKGELEGAKPPGNRGVQGAKPPGIGVSGYDKLIILRLKS